MTKPNCTCGHSFDDHVGIITGAQCQAPGCNCAAAKLPDDFDGRDFESLVPTKLRKAKRASGWMPQKSTDGGATWHDILIEPVDQATAQRVLQMHGVYGEKRTADMHADVDETTAEV